jgi:hypothetical protein
MRSIRAVECGFEIARRARLPWVMERMARSPPPAVTISAGARVGTEPAVAFTVVSLVV